MNQPRIEKMFRLIRLLMSGEKDYTIDELAEMLGMTSRSVYRFVDTFKEAGFAVVKVQPNVYKMYDLPENAPELDKLIYFSDEEAYLVNALLDALVPNNALKKGLRDKLATVYDATSIADFVDRRSNAANVQNLAKAAKGKKKVVLKDYESGNSHTVRDRLVEPYGFTTDYIDVCAYDLEDGKNKIFKVQRIGEVVILDEGWTAEESHQRQGMDIFRMTGPTIGHIKWQMTVMAKNLLLEEYPLAEKCLRRKINSWILDADISNWAGACRFYVGLAKEIKVLKGKEFEEYVKGYLKTTFKEF